MSTLERVSEILAILHREGPQQPLATFHDWTFDLLRPLVEFDTGFWGVGAWAANGEPVMRNVHLHRLPATMSEDWDAMKMDPAHQAILARFVSTGRSTGFGPEDLTDDPFWTKYDISSIVTSSTVDPTTRLLYIFSFYRSHTRPSFDERDCEIHQALVPHLFEVERKVWLREFSARHTQETGDTDNQAICDREGTLRLIQQGFVRALLTEWPNWKGPAVPEKLGEAVCLGKTGELVGERSVFVVTQRHDMFILSARQRGPIDALSPREKIVAHKWARGYSYKEIAARMKISPATVRNHVARIYDKLAVIGRQQLSEMLGER